MRSRSRLVLALGLLAALLSGCGGDTDDSAHNTQDVMFAQMMIVHHQAAVDMATQGEQKATTDAVKGFATQVRNTQQPEIATMTQWLSDWNEPTTSSMLHDMHDSDAMAALATATGLAYDKAWLEAMIEHHGSAIDMANTEIAQGSSQAAKDLATSISDSQKEEIEQMRTVLRQMESADAAANVEEVTP